MVSSLRLNSNDILHPSGSSFLCIVCIIRQYLSSSTIRSRERACPSRSQGDEAPYAVAKNIMTKHHSSATISLKREFTKEDKLIPVITITVYLGTKEWDGPRKLSDMFGDVDEELLPFIPDYRINLLAPREITDLQDSGHPSGSFSRYCRMRMIRKRCRKCCRMMKSLAM